MAAESGTSEEDDEGDDRVICGSPLEWKQRVTMHGCQIHDDPAECEPPLQGAHVLPQQALKRRGLHAHLWDTRNGVGSCYRAHRRSDGALERFPREKIPPQADEFAQEHGLGWMLDNLYPRKAEQAFRDTETNGCCKDTRSGDTENPGSEADSGDITAEGMGERG